MLTDVFAADPGAVSGYKKAGFPAPGKFGFSTVRARDFDPVRLALLDCSISSVPFSVALHDACRTPGQEPNFFAGPVVSVLSERTVRWFLSAENEDISQILTQWKEFDELNDVSPLVLESFSYELRRLCREASMSHMVVLVWNCL
jgi:hypothetical protein